MNKDKEMNYYKIIVWATVALFLSVCVPYGTYGMANDFATWMNNGFSSEDARCAKAFNIDVEGE